MKALEMFIVGGRRDLRSQMSFVHSSTGLGLDLCLLHLKGVARFDWENSCIRTFLHSPNDDVARCI